MDRKQREMETERQRYGKAPRTRNPSNAHQQYLLPSVRPHLLKFTPPPKVVPPAEVALQHTTPTHKTVGKFHSQTIIGPESKTFEKCSPRPSLLC
jgi:hypothetical protein